MNYLNTLRPGRVSASPVEVLKDVFGYSAFRGSQEVRIIKFMLFLYRCRIHITYCYLRVTTRVPLAIDACGGNGD